MNKMGTIIGFTFKNKVRTKSFMVTTLIIMILMSIGMNIPYMVKLFQGDKGGNGTVIGLVADKANPAAQLLQTYVSAGGTTKVTLHAYPSADDPDLKKALDDKKVEGYLSLGAASENGIKDATYFSADGKLKGDVQSYLQGALQQINAQLIAGSKLTPEQITAMNTPVAIGTEELNRSGGEAEAASHPVINYVIVYVMLILFFMSIMMTGNMVAAEVTSEKSSRIMEILITSASPLTQMFGKVIGIFLVGLLQIAIITATIALNLSLPHNATVMSEFNLSFSELNYSLLTYGLILYILGYFLFALMYAAVGSIVSRTEDLGQAAMPIMMLSFAAFYIPLFSISAPDTLLVKIASFVPFTSSLTLLLRIGVGSIAWWEILVSIGILLLTTFFFGWLAAKIYRTGVLMYGKRPSIKELRKAMKAYKI